MALRVPLFRAGPSSGSSGAATPGAARKAAPKSVPKSKPEPKPKSKPGPKQGPKPKSARKPGSSPKQAAGRPRKATAGQAPKSRRTLPGWWPRSGGDVPAKSAKSAKVAGPTKSAKPANSAASAKSAARRDAPPAPLLQRRSAVALAARALVLAVLVVAMVAFAVALARVTLVPSPASDALVHTNLRPGASIRAYLDQPDTRDTVKQIGGNILLGVPFGILLPTLFPRTRGLIRVVVVTALVMLMVETTQGAIVEGRAFDIDDVILNTAGSLLGYLALGLRLGRALHPRRPHWYHRYGIGKAPDPAPADPER
ncbi:VanZ family protein [Streptomyces sp. NPDC087270]|uniref:VanZ family protein n=1 Tax=Streptomyces sp. NPDC087270 TaxID=3365774 RepID=UPI0037F82F83